MEFRTKMPEKLIIRKRFDQSVYKVEIVLKSFRELIIPLTEVQAKLVADALPKAYLGGEIEIGDVSTVERQGIP